MTLIDTILEEVHHIFKNEGIDTYSDDEIIRKLSIQHSTFKDLFSGKAELVLEAVKHNLEGREKTHNQVLTTITNPVEGIMYLLQDGISYIKEMNPRYIVDMQMYYPEVWKIFIGHINSHYFYQISEILNAGIMQGFFRKDINLKLVSKIIIEQIAMLLNPTVFPGDQYDLVEVFRSIFLYYLRGLCTETGSRMVENLFSKYKL